MSTEEDTGAMWDDHNRLVHELEHSTGVILNEITRLQTECVRPYAELIERLEKEAARARVDFNIVADQLETEKECAGDRLNAMHNLNATIIEMQKEIDEAKECIAPLSDAIVKEGCLLCNYPVVRTDKTVSCADCGYIISVDCYNLDMIRSLVVGDDPRPPGPRIPPGWKLIGDRPAVHGNYFFYEKSQTWNRLHPENEHVFKHHGGVCIKQIVAIDMQKFPPEIICWARDNGYRAAGPWFGYSSIKITTVDNKWMPVASADVGFISRVLCKSEEPENSEERWQDSRLVRPEHWKS